MTALAIFGFGPLVHAPYPVSGASAFVLLVFTPLLAPFIAIVSGSRPSGLDGHRFVDLFALASGHDHVF